MALKGRLDPLTSSHRGRLQTAESPPSRSVPPLTPFAPLATTHRRRWRAWNLWDEQQLAGGPAALHVGMGLRRVRQPVLAPDPDLELPFRDPVE
jgi:hypothetical protein